MSTAFPNESHPTAIKLQYLSEFRLLLCTTCKYCVLREALDRHLKYNHHLTIQSRAPYAEQVRDWDLTDISEIKYPSPEHGPIEGIPLLSGYACSAPDCGHLCATTKRMQAHWREEHLRIRQSIAGKDGYRCSRVCMQTFFRSSNLRYFVVRPPRTAKVSGKFKGTIERDAHPWMPLAKSVKTRDTSSTIEWMLAKEFIEVCFAAHLPVKGSRLAWRDQIVQICSDSPYMQFAIQSLAASHVAYTRVDCRSRYAAEADRLRQLAISTFPVRSTVIETHMFFQVFNFQRLMTACCLARMQITQLQDHEAYMQTTSVVPDWIRVQRCGHALIWPLRGQNRIMDALQGPRPQLLNVERLATHDLGNSCNPHDHRLGELSKSLRLLTEYDLAIDRSCFEALDLLRRVWAIPYKEEVVGFRDMALRFTVKVPQRFLDLVHKHDPVALVVFAYFVVLLNLGEEVYWYMRGLATTMLLQIIRYLPAEWQSWIAWPLEMILEES